MTNEMKQEFTARIVSANKSKMVLIIYEIMEVHLQEALAFYEKKERKSYSQALARLRQCLDELRYSVVSENELSKNFMELYGYYENQIRQADVQFDKAPLEQVSYMITSFREAYEEVAKKDTTGSVMDNGESIYAGLTYGRTSLTENLSSESSNRGFLI